MNVFGRVYVSNEGVNAQLSIPDFAWDDFVVSLDGFEFLKGVFVNRSSDNGDEAFIKLDVKVRKKIVADGIQENIFEKVTPGKHLEPTEFHELLDQPDTVVVDTRNQYECEIGQFENAFCPESQKFHEVLPELKEKLKPHQDQKLLLYCTGGIRCEKTSAYLKKEGFENVFQLRGGIINYLNEIEEKGLEPKFKGNMFVFDGRMAEPTVMEEMGECYQCGSKHGVHVDCANIGCHQLMIQCEKCSQMFKGCCSEHCAKELDRQHTT